MKIILLISTLAILISCTETSGFIKTTGTDTNNDQDVSDSLPSLPPDLTDTLLNSEFGNSSTPIVRDGYWLFKDTIVRSIGFGKVLFADSTNLDISYPRLVNGRRNDLIVNYSISNSSVEHLLGSIVRPNQVLGISKNGYSISCSDKNDLPKLFKAKFTVPLKESTILIVNKSAYMMWW